MHSTSKLSSLAHPTGAGGTVSRPPQVMRLQDKATDEVTVYHFMGTGRADAIRIALLIARIPFTFQGLETEDDYEEMKNEGRLPFAQVPVIEDACGRLLTQPNTILRWIAREAARRHHHHDADSIAADIADGGGGGGDNRKSTADGQSGQRSEQFIDRRRLYAPEDSWTAARVDEVLDLVADASSRIDCLFHITRGKCGGSADGIRSPCSFKEPHEDDKAMATEDSSWKRAEDGRESLLQEFVSRLKTILEAEATNFICGDQLTIADIALIPLLRWLRQRSELSATSRERSKHQTSGERTQDRSTTSTSGDNHGRNADGAAEVSDHQQSASPADDTKGFSLPPVLQELLERLEQLEEVSFFYRHNGKDRSQTSRQQPGGVRSGDKEE